MDRDYEQQTFQAEDRHWWYRGRRTVLERVIDMLHAHARDRIDWRGFTKLDRLQWAGTRL